VTPALDDAGSQLQYVALHAVTYIICLKCSTCAYGLISCLNIYLFHFVSTSLKMFINVLLLGVLYVVVSMRVGVVV
jgi:hypothetical protein